MRGIGREGQFKLGVERHLPLVTGITIQPCGVPPPQTTRDNVRQQNAQRQTSVDKGLYYTMVCEHNSTSSPPKICTSHLGVHNGTLEGKGSGYQWSYKQTRRDRGSRQILAEDICPGLCWCSSPCSCLYCGMNLAMTRNGFG
jgi:hypothetical protein